jgi:hypothetical protein
MKGNFGEKKAAVTVSPRKYVIEFNKRKKRWQLKKGSKAIFSSENKKDVDFWYEEVVVKNCVIF